MGMVRAWLESEEGQRVRVVLPEGDARRLFADAGTGAAGAEPEVRVRATEESPYERQFDPTARPIEEFITELAAQVPEEEWDLLPPDLSEQHDHYIYGTPKR